MQNQPGRLSQGTFKPLLHLQLATRIGQADPEQVRLEVEVRIILPPWSGKWHLGLDHPLSHPFVAEPAVLDDRLETVKVEQVAENDLNFVVTILNASLFQDFTLFGNQSGQILNQHASP